MAYSECHIRVFVCDSSRSSAATHLVSWPTSEAGCSAGREEGSARTAARGLPSDEQPHPGGLVFLPDDILGATRPSLGSTRKTQSAECERTSPRLPWPEVKWKCALGSKASRSRAKPPTAEAGGWLSWMCCGEGGRSWSDPAVYEERQGQIQLSQTVSSCVIWGAL